MNEKVWGSVWITQDVCIWEGKIEIALILVTAGAADSTVTFYKGRDSSASILAVVETLTARSTVVSFPKEFLLENGLYIDIDANTTGVLVIYRPISEITE
uniref:Uncharacterized protein n=1 Tax=viral metagenome TaxID=1070528 RepID=A0A6H1ZNN1_9ZZZZ